MRYFISLLFVSSAMASIHPEFVSLDTLCPQIKIQASYATDHNFTGGIVRGYKAQKSYMAKAAATRLCEVQKEALKQGMSLKIFDGYRPVKAVGFFQEWAQMPETNPNFKALFYPKYTRKELFEQGYIASKSSHSRGSAVDLTLFNIQTGFDLDMGSGFDYFDDLSHTNSPKISHEQKKNRMILKSLMEGHGFKNFDQEWWHYSFKPEPFPNDYFDFDVE